MKKKYLYLIFFTSCAGLLLLYTISNSSITQIKPVGKPALPKPPPYSATVEDEQFLKEFEAYVAEVFKKTNTPGASLAIVKNGVTLFHKAYGVKSAHGTDSVDVETLFRLASVSKGFSSVLAGLIVKDSLLNWDDPMANYLPYPLLDSANNITIRHLLSHTAGFPYQAYSTLVEDELPRDTMISRLLKLPLSRNPGEIHSYQNVAYSIIEKILEAVAEKPFTQLMHERLFKPLEMTTASISYDSMINSGNVALPHGFRNRRFVPTKIDRSYYNVAAAGGINASITDMEKWLKAVLGNAKSIIPNAVIDQVFNPVIKIRVKNPYLSQLERPRDGHYGLGWRIIQYPGDTIVYHGGYANGYKSGVALDRSKNIGICILTNAPSKLTSLVMSTFFRMYKAHFNIPPETEPTEEIMLPSPLVYHEFSMDRKLYSNSIPSALAPNF